MMQHDALRYNAIQRDMTRYDTIQHGTIQRIFIVPMGKFVLGFQVPHTFPASMEESINTSTNTVT